MKLFITHANNHYDSELEAKKGIEELIEYFNPDDIFELNDERPPWDSGCEERRYTVHGGEVFDSCGGEFKREYRRKLREQMNISEEEFILTGGYFAACHNTTFCELRDIGAKSFIFPLPAIYDLNVEKPYIVGEVRKWYSQIASIYWDNELECEGAGDETIRIFTTNKKLFEYLK